MPTETGTIDLKAQKAAYDDAESMADDAAKVATDYITEISQDGIWVTPSDAKPSSGSAIATTSGWHISDAIELFKSGVSYIKMWVESNVAKLRLGATTSTHVIIDNDSLDIEDSSSNVLATFGASSATIGRTSSGHLRITSGGVGVNNGNSTVVWMGATSTGSMMLFGEEQPVIEAYPDGRFELYNETIKFIMGFPAGSTSPDDNYFSFQIGSPGTDMLRINAPWGNTIINGTLTAASSKFSVDASGNVSAGAATLTGTAQQQRSGNMNWSEKDTGVDLTLSNNGLSSGTRYMEYLTYDKNGLIPGGVGNEVASEGTVTTRLRCRNYDTSGNAYDNPLVLAVTKAGAKSASLGCDFTLTSGGRLYMNHGTVDTAESGNNVTAATYTAYGVRDRDSRFYQYTQATALTDGGTRAQFAARNNVNGSNVDNIIQLDVSNTGVLSVTLSANAKASWLQQIMQGKTVLYNNAAGSATSVTLSATAANFNHMRIYYSTNTAANATSYANGGVSSVDVYSPNGKYVELLGAHRISDTQVQFRSAIAYVSGTSITVNSTSQGMYANISNGSSPSVGKESKTYIYRVEAWNE